MMNDTLSLIQSARSKRQRRFVILTALLGLISVVLCFMMLMVGNTIYPVKDVIRVLFGEEVKGASFAVGTIRLPRMVAGVFAGFAFGAGGYVFQTMLRNPLANPNVIGITTGSSRGCFLHRYSSCQSCNHFNRRRNWWSMYSIDYLFFSKREFLLHWKIDFNRYWHSGDVKFCYFLFTVDWESTRYTNGNALAEAAV